MYDVIHIPRSYFSLWDFYFDISEWHVLPGRAWTPALMLHLTNPCAKRKVLSLTKPKGKIYKTKSLGLCITMAVVYNTRGTLVIVSWMYVKRCLAKGCRNRETGIWPNNFFFVVWNKERCNPEKIKCKKKKKKKRKNCDNKKRRLHQKLNCL